MSIFNPFRELDHLRQRTLVTSFKQKMRSAFWVIIGRLNTDEKHTYSQIHVGFLDYAFLLLPLAAKQFARYAINKHDKHDTFGTKALTVLARTLYASLLLLKLIITLPLMLIPLVIISVTQTIVKLSADKPKSIIKNHLLSTADIDALKKQGIDTTYITTVRDLLKSKRMSLEQVRSCTMKPQSDDTQATMTLSTNDKSASFTIAKNKRDIAVLKSLDKLHITQLSTKQQTEEPSSDEPVRLQI
jgi:hypothetical protein